MPSIPYELTKTAEGKILRFKFEKSEYNPSIEDEPVVMAEVIEALAQSGEVDEIIFVQNEEYVYDKAQVKILSEVAEAYQKLISEERVLDFSKFGEDCRPYFPIWFDFLTSTVLQELKQDPIGSYVRIIRRIREEKAAHATADGTCAKKFSDLLETIAELLAKKRIIKFAEKQLSGYEIGDRKLYRQLFRPAVRPNFMYTKLATAYPAGVEEIDSYKIAEDAQIMILKSKNDIRPMYHITPPEFKLTEDKYALLTAARAVLAGHRPERKEFTDLERTRENFVNIEKDLIRDLANARSLTLKPKEIEELARILVRYTIGFGMVELILSDENIQDIVINAPAGANPISVMHSKYGECLTNATPLHREVESWATKLRLMSGRPLDQANPVLDTELFVPHGRARVAAMQEPLSPKGYAFAFRRHRDRPWTLPLFIQNGMISSLAAGVMSFLMDGARTLLIAGSRSSGKTSILDALMLEISRNNRVVIVEDTLELNVAGLRKLGYDALSLKVRSAVAGSAAEVSAEDAIRTALRLGDSALIVGEVRSSIPGWEEVLVIENGVTKRVPIEELENKNIGNFKVPTLDFDLKVNLKPLAGFVKHPKRNRLLEVVTKTGRRVVVTPDHSLFHAAKDFKIAPIECKDLKKGDSIVIPASLPIGFNDVDELNVIDLLPEFRLENFESHTRSAIEKLGWKKATQVASVSSGDIYNYFRTAPDQQINLPISSFNNLMQEAEIDFDIRPLRVTRGTGNSVPAVIPVNEDFCRFLGYYVSEGYYRLAEGEGGDVVLTNSNQRLLSDMIALSRELFDIEPKLKKVYGLGESTQVRMGSSALATLISRLNCGRLAAEKRVPPFIFGLSRPKIAAFLRGLYSGDGSFTSSESNGNCARYFSTSRKLVEDVAYLLLVFGIVGTIRCQKARDTNSNDLWSVTFKDRDMVETFFKEIGFNREVPKMIVKGWKHTQVNRVRFDKEELRKHLLKHPRQYRHLFRFQRCSKNYLKAVVNDPECKVSEQLRTFANGEFFLDEVKEVRELKLEKPVPVYDISVEPSQNFIGGFGGVLLHNTEAKALYEAMRVGALAKVVAGTIHGDSPYGVFDRVVNDIGVPKTSFKATDIILVTNPITSPSGLEHIKRVVQITEVGKTWTDDPLVEKGFRDLFIYNPKKDTLEPTSWLKEGESEVIKAIGSRVKEWSGDWDAIWDNIQLRARIKQMIVDTAEKEQNFEILEAPFVIKSNEQFHRISDIIAKETGKTDAKKVYAEWEHWFKQQITKNGEG